MLTNGSQVLLFSQINFLEERSNMLLSREKLVLLVKESLRDAAGLQNVAIDKEIDPRLFGRVIDLLSEKIGLKIIVGRGKPHRGWKVCTVAGYVYHNQATFSLMESLPASELVTGSRPENR